MQPSVSTDGNERTIAFFFAIRRVPNARHVVITAGRPSGIAATAKMITIHRFRKRNEMNKPRATAILK